jgi:hypothetical protein
LIHEEVIALIVLDGQRDGRDRLRLTGASSGSMVTSRT